MTTVNQDYPSHSRARPSNSPHLPAIQDPHSQHAQQQQQPQQHAHSQAAVTDAWTEAFARLQQQVQYNTTALEDQRRYLAEFNDVVRTLHAEIGSLWRKVDALKDQREARPRPSGAVKPDDADIDLLTSELQHVANKANEIDGVKIQLEIMTRRLKRLEGHPSPATAPTAAAETAPYQPHPHHPAAAQYPPPQQHRPSVAAKPEERSLDRPQAHLQPPAESRPVDQSHGPDSRGPAFRPVDGPNGTNTWRTANHGVPQPDGASAARADGHAAPAWNAVNNAQFGKRTASMDGSGHHDGSAPGSPKRQKLATLAPRSQFEAATNGQGAPHQHSYEPAQAPRSVSGEVPHAAAPGAPIRFVPFPGRESNGHEVRRPEPADGRPRNRKSGGEEDVKPDTEWREWSAANGDYPRHPQHAYHLSAPPSDHYRQPQSYSPDGHLGETPSPALNESNKKSRTKPTRNADGILIRKDGRPDMRSISSAMNLRKVHAKKEAERTSGPGEGDTPATNEGEDNGSVIDGPRSATPPEHVPAPAREDVTMADSVPKPAAAAPVAI